MVDQPKNPNAVREATEAAEKVIQARQAAENAKRADAVDGMTPKQMASALNALNRDAQDQQKEPAPLAAGRPSKTHQTRQSTAFDGQSRAGKAAQLTTPQKPAPAQATPAPSAEAEQDAAPEKPKNPIYDILKFGSVVGAATVGVGLMIGTGPVGLIAAGAVMTGIGGAAATVLDRGPLNGELTRNTGWLDNLIDAAGKTLGNMIEGFGRALNAKVEGQSWGQAFSEFREAMRSDERDAQHSAPSPAARAPQRGAAPSQSAPTPPTQHNAPAQNQPGAPEQQPTAAAQSETAPVAEAGRHEETASQRTDTTQQVPPEQINIGEKGPRTINDAPTETVIIDATDPSPEQAAAKDETPTFNFGTIEAGEIEDVGAALDKAGVRQAERGSGEAVSTDGPSSTISVIVDDMGGPQR